MIQCTHCTYAGNPDTATNCVKCRALLIRRGSTVPDEDFQAQRGKTAVEDYPAAVGSARRQTVAEGVAQSGSYTPPAQESDSGPARWKDSGPSVSAGAAVAAGASASSGQPPASRPMAQSDQAQRRRTVYIGTPVDEPAAAAAPPRTPPAPGTGAVRKIVGVLITYSWEEQGQVFPVFEGRNLIGKDPAQCNICIPQDATLSDVNSSIAYRSQFVIRDKDSMSGTFVDGGFVEAEPIPLRNYARIRTGSTHWIFLAVNPPASPSADAPATEA